MIPPLISSRLSGIISTGPENCFEIELKHCASSKASFKSSQKYFVHVNWIRLANNPHWLNCSMSRATVNKPEDASSNSPRDPSSLQTV